MRNLTLVLVSILVGAGTSAAEACGDKFLRVGRGARYQRNCQVLIEGMRAMGFRPLLPDALQAPIIVTFHTPADPRFDFKVLYDKLAERGYLIYPGKLTKIDSFRIGCIGRLSEADMRGALAAIREVLAEMGVRIPVPAAR